ncbi:HPr family phosphocarrier protein [Nocardioides dongxiaopingii]|uniref:HPr family phosphocarrier protein n=1 Tax=Nocardioides dongxiaopingii TaxID=2576036 RepID=UPI001BAF8297
MLTNPQGLHARPAALLATAVGELDAEVRITHDGRSADAASSLELMTLGAAQGAEVVVSATGADADAAVRAVSALVADGFGET